MEEKIFSFITGHTQHSTIGLQTKTQQKKINKQIITDCVSKHYIIRPSDMSINKIVGYEDKTIKIKASVDVIAQLQQYTIKCNDDKRFFIRLTDNSSLDFSWPELG